MKLARPSNLELQALSVLWSIGQGTVYDVLASLPDRKPRAYTTVLSVLQNLEVKGLVKATYQGRQKIFFATKTRSYMVGAHIRDLVKRVFQGRATEFLAQILAEVTLTAGEARAVAGLLLRQKRGAVGAALNIPTNKINTMAAKKKAAKKAAAKKAPAKKAPAKKAAAKKAAPKAKAAKKKAPAKKVAKKK